MSRPVDKTKKSNIKCEHCKYWGCIEPVIASMLGEEVSEKCNNDRAESYSKPTHYYNRCKGFEWKENI